MQSYYIEVVDPTTGETIKSVELAAPCRVDTNPDRLNQPVIIDLTDLAPGTAYILLAYARECYQKSSEPLITQFTTVQ